MASEEAHVARCTAPTEGKQHPERELTKDEVIMFLTKIFYLNMFTRRIYVQVWTSHSVKLKVACNVYFTYKISQLLCDNSKIAKATQK